MIDHHHNHHHHSINLVYGRNNTRRIFVYLILAGLLFTQFCWYSSITILCQKNNDQFGVSAALNQSNENIDDNNNNIALFEANINNHTNITSSVNNDYDYDNPQNSDDPLWFSMLTATDLILPSHFDWRHYGKVSRVKDQGSCNACYAFAATSAIESSLAIHYNIDLRNATPIGDSDIYPTAVQVPQMSGIRPLVDAEHIAVEAVYNLRNVDISLSVQELVDCTNRASSNGQYLNNGCSYGFIEETFRYIIQNGLASSSDYPFVFNQTKCQSFRPSINRTYIYDYRALVMNQTINVDQIVEQIKRLILTKGPIISLINDKGDDFFNHRGGIIRVNTFNNSAQLNSSSGSSTKQYSHAVLIVGWGVSSLSPPISASSSSTTITNGTTSTTKQINYWIIKNSWSTDWGESGFARIEFGARGIAKYLYYPILTGPSCSLYNYYSTTVIYVLLAVLVGSMALFYGLATFFTSKIFKNRRKYASRLVVKFRVSKKRHFDISQTGTDRYRSAQSGSGTQLPASWSRLDV